MFDFTTIFFVGLIGGLVPLFLRWGDRQHHMALAFSTGVFLGAVFLHLLPSVAAQAEAAAAHDHGTHIVEAIDPHAGHDHPPGEHVDDDSHGEEEEDHSGHDHPPGEHPEEDHADEDVAVDTHAHDAHGAEDDGDDPHAGHVHGSIGPWLWVLVGLIGVFLVEAMFIPGTTHGHGHGHDDAKRHSAVGWAALVGLTVHALTAGVALAAVQSQEAIAGVMLLAILAHKGFESFSLASVFSMTGAARGKILTMVVLFSLVTPLGLLLGGQVTGLLGEQGIAILTSLAAGTFLYVCLCELLPEVFHRREDGPWKIGLLVLGIVCMWYAHSYGGI